MDESNIREFVFRVRTFLEPLWFRAHEGWDNEPIPNPLSKYMCRYSCIFLKKILKEKGFGDWEIHLGRPLESKMEGTKDGTFGYCTQNGLWHDHAWLAKENRVIDITADQFGGPPIYVGKYNPSIYNKNLTEADVTEALNNLLRRVNEWFLIWYKQNSQ